MGAKTTTEWEMPSAQQAQADVDRLTERAMAGEVIDLAELAAAKAVLELAARKSEFDAKARAKAKREAEEARADEADERLAREAPPVAERLVDAITAAKEALRTLAAAAAEYQATVGLAVRQVEAAGRHPARPWPHGIGLLEDVLKEVTAVTAQRESGMGRTPMSDQLQAALGRPTPEMLASWERRAEQRSAYERRREEAGKRAREQQAQACLDSYAKGTYQDPRDVAEARTILGLVGSGG